MQTTSPTQPLTIDDIHKKGCLYYKEGRIDDAITQFSLVLRLMPQHFPALCNLGNCFAYKEDMPSAIACYTRAIALHTTPSLEHNLGVALVKEGQFMQARPYLERVTAATNDADAWFHLGLVYQSVQPDDAYACFEKAIAARPSHMEAHHNLACCYLAQDNFEKALSHYEYALALAPDNVTAAHFVNALKGTTPTVVNHQFVQQLFDQYAGHYESHLKTIGYTLPATARGALTASGLHAHAPFKTLDIGCGTGLGAVAFADCIEHIVGVDVSAEMLFQARNKNVYKSLHHMDALAFLIKNTTYFNLFLALELFNYISDIKPVLHALYNHSETQGVLICSTEDGESGILKNGRIAHTVADFNTVLVDTGWNIRLQQAVVLRTDKGMPVMGTLTVAQRR